MAQVAITSVLTILMLLTDAPKVLVTDFESNAVGSTPGEFLVGSPQVLGEAKWEVALDGTNKVLSFKDPGGTKGRCRLAILRSPAVTNARLSVRIRIQPGNAEQGGGVVWHYQNLNNYLIAQLCISQKSIFLYRVVNGNRIKFADAKVPALANNTWYTLRIEQKDQNVMVYLDDEMILKAKDKHFSRPGLCGVCAPRGATASFDDLKILNLEDAPDRQPTDPAR